MQTVWFVEWRGSGVTGQVEGRMQADRWGSEGWAEVKAATLG